MIFGPDRSQCWRCHVPITCDEPWEPICDECYAIVTGHDTVFIIPAGSSWAELPVEEEAE